MQKVLKVSINGIQYAITTDENEKNIYQAAELVDTLMKKKSEGQTVSGRMGEKLAIVTALEIAADLHKSRQCLESYERRVSSILKCLDTK